MRGKANASHETINKYLETFIKAVPADFETQVAL